MGQLAPETASIAELPAPIENVGTSPPHGARKPRFSEAKVTGVSPLARHEALVDTLATSVEPFGQTSLEGVTEGVYAMRLCSSDTTHEVSPSVGARLSMNVDWVARTSENDPLIAPPFREAEF